VGSIRAIDHLVLTVTDIDETVRFYERLGMRREAFGDGRVALHFGDQKLNLHAVGAEIAPHARHPTRGSADVCFLIDGALSELEADLTAAGVQIEVGPVPRTGAQGPIYSIYVRDPDGNLVELSEPVT
jgi:catechol 2,3-dioxygenase-like lactoylglutathione lyase family enzyme